jgi:hypothetical protein
VREPWSAYAERGHRTVGGWLSDTAIAVLQSVERAQAAANVFGPCCEIGVHHGRLFILMHLMTPAPHRSVAFDLFERQHENIDGSGRGNRDILLRHLRAHGGDLERISAVAANSADLSPGDILRHCGGHVALFSVDGGHTAALTRNDLALAEATVLPGGVVILDDCFNEAWPGVGQGFAEHMAQGSTLIPFAIGGNKVLLTNNAASARAYAERIDAERSRFEARHAELYGSEVLVVVPPDRSLRARVRDNALWKRISDTRVGRFIKLRVP